MGIEVETANRSPGKMAHVGKRLAQKAVDWTRLSQNIPAAATAQFNAFRNRHETIKGSLNKTQAKPTPIDWEHYGSVVKNKALVEKMKAGYQKVSVPYPEDVESASIAEKEKAIEAEIAQTSKATKEAIAKLHQEIAKIQAQKPFEEMTTDEYMAANPDLKREADREISEIGWR